MKKIPLEKTRDELENIIKKHGHIEWGMIHHSWKAFSKIKQVAEHSIKRDSLTNNKMRTMEERFLFVQRVMRITTISEDDKAPIRYLKKRVY